MGRAPFNVLVYAFRIVNAEAVEYVLLRRADNGAWQGVSGGGEDSETPIEAANRELFEELGVRPLEPLVQLDAVEPIPAAIFRDSENWGEDVFVIPQYGYGARIQEQELKLSPEHIELRWLHFDEAFRLLRYNHTPLWELHARLLGLGPRGTPRPG
jgi:dATP pyrophosphohydrolase